MTYLAKLFVVMASIQQEFEDIFMSEHSSPRKRCKAAHARIRVPHVSPLYQPLDEEQVVLYKGVDCKLRFEKAFRI